MREIYNEFQQNRSTLPSMFIATPDDRIKSQWTHSQPSGIILNHAVMLARVAIKQMEAKLEAGSQLADLKVQ